MAIPDIPLLGIPAWRERAVRQRTGSRHKPSP
jgi:hypothetical protein